MAVSYKRSTLVLLPGRQRLRRGRQKSIFPQRSGFQTWRAPSLARLNESTSSNTLAWLDLSHENGLVVGHVPLHGQHERLRLVGVCLIVEEESLPTGRAEIQLPLGGLRRSRPPQIGGGRVLKFAHMKP